MLRFRSDTHTHTHTHTPCLTCPLAAPLPFTSHDSRGSFVWVNCRAVICICLSCAYRSTLFLIRKNMLMPFVCVGGNVCVCVCVLTHHSSVSVCVIIAGGEGDGGESSCRINTHCNYYAPFALVHMLLLP